MANKQQKAIRKEHQRTQRKFTRINKKRPNSKNRFKK